jgi:hypothetical protein
MGFPTLLASKHTRDDLRVRWRFLAASVKQDPHAAPYVAPVMAFAATWAGMDQKFKSLEDAVADAQAAAIYNDRLLDGLADEIWTAIYGTKRITAHTLLGKLYFGSAMLAAFKDPVLGPELEGATFWPGHLAQATSPALLALAPKGATIVAAASGAATKLTATLSDVDMFEKGGELQATFDAFNALCTTVHAGLAAFALANPDLALGNHYADSFFMHTARSSQPTTVGAAADLVAQLQKKLGVAVKLHDELVTEKTQKAEAAAAHEKAVEEAAAKKKQADDLKKEAAAAKKAADKLKPKKK